MTLEHLNNLVNIKQLKTEPPDQREFDGMGYRSDKHYLVFQCLTHTLELPVVKTRVFSLCYQRRNLAEYEGHLEINDQFLEELISLTDELLVHVQTLAPVK